MSEDVYRPRKKTKGPRFETPEGMQHRNNLIVVAREVFGLNFRQIGEAFGLHRCHVANIYYQQGGAK